MKYMKVTFHLCQFCEIWQEKCYLATLAQLQSLPDDDSDDDILLPLSRMGESQRVRSQCKMNTNEDSG